MLELIVFETFIFKVINGVNQSLHRFFMVLPIGAFIQTRICEHGLKSFYILQTVWIGVQILLELQLLQCRSQHRHTIFVTYVVPWPKHFILNKCNCNFSLLEVTVKQDIKMISIRKLPRPRNMFSEYFQLYFMRCMTKSKSLSLSIVVSSIL